MSEFICCLGSAWKADWIEDFLWTIEFGVVWGTANSVFSKFVRDTWSAKQKVSAMPKKPHMRDRTDNHALAGVRVLVVEDVAVLAMLAEAHLVSFGCEIAGRAATTVKALDLIEDAKIDVALLDISLREETSFGVADTLAKKGVPYVFVTAHGRDRIPDEHSGVPLLQKPYEPAGLRSAILRGLGLEVV